MYGTVRGHQMFSPSQRAPFPFNMHNRQGPAVRSGFDNRPYRRNYQQTDSFQSVTTSFGNDVIISGSTFSTAAAEAASSAAAAAVVLALGDPLVVSSALVPDRTGNLVAAVSDQTQDTAGGGGGQLITIDATNEHQNVANIKEKTPMCLVNEWARFNKIPHQYTLTDEQGPAHKKVFFVKLKLGDEEFAATGQSIKKAQHAAAKIALEQTNYKRPPPKSHRSAPTASSSEAEHPSITPTVELNALAMKRGESVVYHPVERHRPVYYPMATYDYRGMYNQRYSYPRPPHIFYVSLKVGPREFIGEGKTLQSARHHAAGLALNLLKELPLPEQTLLKAKTKDTNDSTDSSSCADEDNKENLKSVISLVHEIALKRNFAVNFEVTKESGPPHLRNFITRCLCGHLVVDGEGKSKKLSKKVAAEKMLEEMGKLSPLPPSVEKPKRIFSKPKQNKTLIKIQKASPDYGASINPISRLIQIQQAKKEKEPVYTLLSDKGTQKFHEFSVQVAVAEKNCSGSGPNKKLAKRHAAEQMLQLLGYSRPCPQPSKPAIKTNEAVTLMAVGGDKKVKFVDQDQSPGHVRKFVPGVIVVPGANSHLVHGQNGSFRRENTSSAPNPNRIEFSNETTATIVSEVLNTGSSSTAELMMNSVVNTVNGPPLVQSSIRPKDQLLYLARILGFEVQFTNFPKGGNKSEFMSLVSLSTSPPQHSHGSGMTIEAANDGAALEALRTLADLGLDGMGCGNVPGERGDGHKKISNSSAVKMDLKEATEDN